LKKEKKKSEQTKIDFEKINQSRLSKKRSPYFIQIGFDFGTSYSKCIYRDIMTQKAWVYIPDKVINKNLPFLISNVILYNNGKISLIDSTDKHYIENGLFHIKRAIVATANDDWFNPLLNSYKNITGLSQKEDLYKFIENCAVFCIAKTIGAIKRNIRNQFKDFGTHEQDYMAINLAIPVCEAERMEINNLFHKILIDAWLLADLISDEPYMNFEQIGALREEIQNEKNEYVESACYVYPEVSANVQGFVRSRFSAEGIYLFSDIGAGNVDLSVFIFHHYNNTEMLTYLCGHVVPLGAGQIEMIAAKLSGKNDPGYLEYLRLLKERGENNSELLRARKEIEKKLIREAEKTLANAKNKLRVKKDINKIKLIFGGGGYCENPYGRAILNPFSGQIFSEPIYPLIISMPPPHDLVLKQNQYEWMKRLSVAYGLSYERSELANFIYPKDVPIPQPEEIWNPTRNTIEAPSKDQC